MMKRFAVVWVALFGLLLVPGNAKGQSLKDILKSSAVKDVVSSVTGGQALTAENIQGTWTYVNPALRLEGDNALKNVAGSLATAEVEKKLKEYCAKVGIEEGVFNYKFNADGSFTSALKKAPSKSVSSRKGVLEARARSVGYSSAAHNASVMTATMSLYRSIL